jgi:DNA mismatch repair protein MutS
MKEILDLERIVGRLSLSSGNARDMRGLAASLGALEKLADLLSERCPEMAERNPYRLQLLPELRLELERALVDEPPLSVRDGGMIRDGYNAELDQLRALSREGKGFIQALQSREIARTGINSLKVRYNRVFGYYIEVSNANLDQVPEDYVRKQTLANAERFSTPELKQYEEKVLTAEEKILAIENRLFEQLRGQILAAAESIKEGAAAAAHLDVMVSLALTGWENRYTRPRLGTGFDLRIIGGRHPVIEKLNPQDKFVPNDTVLTSDRRLALITGPNMGGKSTYLRQTALIVLMAHLGMYVPADSAEIPLVDRIFTRVGASDNLVKGQSTFWLEMEETAQILRQAGEKSLVVLDEIGRGTSTFDGVSIAWGVLEYLHGKIGAKTLFASHYHELIALADTLPRAANLSVRVQESPQGVVFLYLVGEGGVDRSYGIEVARRAGLPDEVIARAKEILRDLEKENIGSGQQSFGFWAEHNANGVAGCQAAERTRPERSHAGLQRLRELEIDRLTPLEALNKLEEIKKLIEQDG